MQQALLKMLEGSVVNVPDKANKQNPGKKDAIQIDTTNSKGFLFDMFD